MESSAVAGPERPGERGFTLIELLVVIVIISALAAIAIPVFVAQRKKGWDAAAKSDLRNAATAQETYFTEGNGPLSQNIYASDVAGIESQGFNPSDSVILTITVDNTSGSQSFCMSARHQDAAPSRVWYLSSDGGDPSLVPC